MPESAIPKLTFASLVGILSGCETSLKREGDEGPGDSALPFPMEPNIFCSLFLSSLAAVDFDRSLALSSGLTPVWERLRVLLLGEKEFHGGRRQ